MIINPHTIGSNGESELQSPLSSDLGIGSRASPFITMDMSNLGKLGEGSTRWRPTEPGSIGPRASNRRPYRSYA